MSIRFKFRSSPSFDSVDIEGRPSISVRELRAKIISHKKLNRCQDFDLVFSDPITGLEYNEEGFQIPSNSSVIIRRVPAGSLPSAPPIDSVVNSRMKNSNPLNEKGGEMDDVDDFDDFGIDLCPVPEEIFPSADLEVDKKNGNNIEKTNMAGSRLNCQILQPSDLSEAIPRGFNHSGTEGNIPLKKLETKVEEHMKPPKVVGPNALAEQNADLPPELRCPLCNAFFKEAVMIPCCQHSFCEKCIRGVLIEKAVCPKCSSRKCSVENLLPNLSLRQAIEHFLESQNLVDISENALREYAPDGESGIQARDFSSAVSTVKKRPGYPLSPSGTEKGSNQVIGQHVSFQGRPGKPPHVADFQGENYVHDEGGGKSFQATARYRKVDRSCYMCGAPDHFIRDCPFAVNQHHMLQTGNTMYPGGMPGFAQPYWNVNSFAPMRPFTGMYGNPGMMPFNASMGPVSPYGVPPYMSSMYGHLSSPRISRMGGPRPPVGNRAQHPLADSEFLECHDFESKGKLANDGYLTRRRPCDDEDFDEGSRHTMSDRSREYKSRTAREKSGSYSGDTQRSRRENHHNKHLDQDRHGKKNFHSSRDRRPHHSERSNSGVEDFSSSSDRYDDRYRRSRKHHEKRGHGSDSSRSRQQRQKEKDSSSSGDQNKQSKERDYSHCSRDGAKRVRDVSCHDRWKVARPDEECGEGYRNHKRKRII